MHVLITVVGQRTEHWTALFAALTRQPGTAITVLAADVSTRTRRELRKLADQHPNLRCEVVPHLLGEAHTGHMASVLFGPGIRRALDGRRPDVVHVIGEAAYLSTWQVLRMRHRHWPTVPVTLYAAQNVVQRFPYPFPLLERRAYARVQHIFPITPAAREVVRSKGWAGPATVVPLGVDTERFRPAPTPWRTGGFTAGFVGRLEPHKGVRDLLRAAELADCGLVVVGEGSLTPDVRHAAMRRPGRIRLHGWVDHHELPGLLRTMDVLVLPSVEVVQRNLVRWIGIPLREQFGRVLVEAMACGVPVIGSDVGEIPYVIGPAGLTYPAGDVAALADRLRQLRADPHLAARLAGDGTLRVTRRFDWNLVAETMCGVWRQLIGRIAPTVEPADREALTS